MAQLFSANGSRRHLSGGAGRWRKTDSTTKQWSRWAVGIFTNEERGRAGARGVRPMRREGGRRRVAARAAAEQREEQGRPGPDPRSSRAPPAAPPAALRAQDRTLDPDFSVKVRPLLGVLRY